MTACQATGRLLSLLAAAHVLSGSCLSANQGPSKCCVGLATACSFVPQAPVNCLSRGLHDTYSEALDLPIREAKGCTVRLVPITMRRSACEKSVAMYWKKRAGRLSPKNTMSGLTRPSATIVHVSRSSGRYTSGESRTDTYARQTRREIQTNRHMDRRRQSRGHTNQNRQAKTDTWIQKANRQGQTHRQTNRQRQIHRQTKWPRHTQTGRSSEVCSQDRPSKHRAQHSVGQQGTAEHGAAGFQSLTTASAITSGLPLRHCLSDMLQAVLLPTPHTVSTCMHHTLHMCTCFMHTQLAAQYCHGTAQHSTAQHSTAQHSTA